MRVHGMNVHTCLGPRQGDGHANALSTKCLADDTPRGRNASQGRTAARTKRARTKRAASSRLSGGKIHVRPE
eukprot:5878186-Lingulodinium_polyedra.AAC.1